MSTPTSTALLAVQRAVHAFFAAAHALLADDPADAGGPALGLDTQLCTALEALRGATSRREIHATTDALRHRFLALSRAYLT